MNEVLHSDRKEFSSILEGAGKAAENRLNNQEDSPAGLRVENIHLQYLP